MQVVCQSLGVGYGFMIIRMHCCRRGDVCSKQLKDMYANSGYGLFGSKGSTSSPVPPSSASSIDLDDLLHLLIDVLFLLSVVDPSLVMPGDEDKPVLCLLQPLR